MNAPANAPTASLTLRGLRARAVVAPMSRPLATGGGAVTRAQLVLVDLFTDEGLTGSSYLFVPTPLVLKPIVELLQNIEPLIRGDTLAPLAIEAKLARHFRLLGLQGLVAIALAGIDMAAWDALAKAHRVPLCRLLGAAPRLIRAYNSCGVGITSPGRAAEEAAELLALGFQAVKVRLGYADARADAEVIRAVRGAVGDAAFLMTDYNQCLSVAEAVNRATVLDHEGIYWIEEPVLADDYAGSAKVAQSARTPVQLGENWWGPHDMAKSLAAGASDYVMPDAMRIGGVSGWLRAAALAESAGTPMSSHLFPEISAHLLAATPTCHWLEYVDWANAVLAEPLVVKDGFVSPSTAPGAGIAWDEAAVKRYAVG
jgi:mandelate racemase